MDYQTKPTSRKQLRLFSIFLRKAFGVSETEAFPVLEALEKISDVFPGSGYIIVDDEQLPPTIMAQCHPNSEGGFTIEIKNSIYRGAYEANIGAFRGFICHEICHIFLFTIGFTPRFERGFCEKTIPAYCSVEWQAKALCAEVMIPYAASKGMSEADLISHFGVSKAFAARRTRL